MIYSNNALKLLQAMYKNYIDNNSKEFTDSDFKLLNMSESDFNAAATELHNAKLIFNETENGKIYLYLLFKGVTFAQNLFK